MLLHLVFIMINFVGVVTLYYPMTERMLYIFFRNDPDIVITRPDKGNGVVILNRCDYVNKMNDI